MIEWLKFAIIIAVACMTGCMHTHSVVVVDADGGHELIKTKYRYSGLPCFEIWQPEVFGPDGIEIERGESVATLKEEGGGWTFVLSALTCWTFPVIETAHEHETESFRVAGTNGFDVMFCKCGSVVASIANTPLPLLFHNWRGDKCFGNGRTFSCHKYGEAMGTYIDYNLQQRAEAYALAVRLKELEDAGKIDDELVAKAMFAQLVTKVGGMLKWMNGQLHKRGIVNLDIAEFNSETDRDFSYRFLLSQTGRLHPAHFGAIREAFRSTVRSLHSMKHPDVNPRSLAVDFVEYSVSNGQIRGKVEVLTIETESLSYDASTRKGRIAVRVGVNQIDEARRWMRKNIGELAARSNVMIKGDEIPAGAIFYSGNESLHENGLLEMEFETE